MGTFVNSIALIIVALITILLGIRPAVRAIIAARPAEVQAVPAITGGEPDALPAQVQGQAGPAGSVNLIEDVTKRMNRSPQKRLEQIIEYDEEQAAAILRQWLHQDEAA
jgi:flagellar M-ring protein FliF